MDRDEIERRDFPSARRGYDPAAVDAHLREVADAVARQRSGSLAEGASTQVRAILEAAEAGAQQLRDEAGREAGEHVERVEDAAKGMLEKLDRLQAELDRLLDGLKSSAETLAHSLEELSHDVGTLAGPAPEPEVTPAAPPSAGAAPEPEATPAAPPSAGPAPEPETTPAAPPSAGPRSDDEAGARLVALNMALEGTPREETARFLAEHYELGDVDALLDDVYASAGR